MIGESLDRLVAWFSPAKGAKRSHARRVYENGRTIRRGYDSAKTDRLNSNWRTDNRSADLEMQSDASKIRARARDLVRNNAYAKGIVNALLRNVVGCGIVPQARVMDSQDEAIESINDELDTLFDRWARVADAAGRLTYWEMERLAYREVIEAGECLIHFTMLEDDRARPLQLALELIDADRLAEDFLTTRRTSLDTANEIRRGVEVDSLGRPVAYWIYPSHPNDLNTGWIAPVRRPASEFLHLYKCDRIGQTRGVSLFAPLVGWLKNLHYYVDNELQASAVSSCFTAAITTMSGPADGGLLASDESSDTDTDGNTFESLQPGMVARLMPGEDVKMIDPSRPNSQADAWINLMLRSLAVGAGLSYERMARDYTQTNYSSARSSDLEDRKEFRADQDWLAYHLVGPVWQRFVECAVLEGRLSIDAQSLISDYDRFTNHICQPPGWEWVDPMKEAESSALALENNLTTLADELGQRGRDLVDTLRQRKREKDLMDELGLTPELISPVKPGVAKKTTKQEATNGQQKSKVTS
jgi:lambda family phage portal protein